MKTLRLVLLTLAMAAAFFACGCEHDGDEDSLDLSIRVSDHLLCSGERCELSARMVGEEPGDRYSGADFYWSLSDPSIGRLSRNRGHHVEYIPTRFPAHGEKDFAQTIYCKFDGDILWNGAIFNHHASRTVYHRAGKRP